MPNTYKILMVDDDLLVREAVVKILQIFGYEVAAAANGQEALQLVDDSFSVIILDINMPVLDGFATLRELNQRKLEIPVLFLTGAGTMDYAVKAINLGAYDFIQKPINDIDLFGVKVQRAIEKRMYVLMSRAYEQNLQREVALKTKELEAKNLLLNEYSRQLEQSTLVTITTLMIALEEKDRYTAGHTKRVTQYSRMIGQAMGLPNEDIEVLSRACQVHDIGKLVIDVSCIQKPGPLSQEEWDRVTRHPEIGHNIIQPLKFLRRESTIIRHHHERVDGTGYPFGLQGDEIDLLTKILTVADSYDAMTSMRSYKVNMTTDDAIGELHRCSGSQFDPEVVSAFTSLLRPS